MQRRFQGSHLIKQTQSNQFSSHCLYAIKEKLKCLFYRVLLSFSKLDSTRLGLSRNANRSDKATGRVHRAQPTLGSRPPTPSPCSAAWPISSRECVCVCTLTIHRTEPFKFFSQSFFKSERQNRNRRISDSSSERLDRNLRQLRDETQPRSEPMSSSRPSHGVMDLSETENINFISSQHISLNLVN